MPKLTFRGAMIRYVDMRYDPDAAATYLRVYFTAELSDIIMREMKWDAMRPLEDLPDDIQTAIQEYIKTHGQMRWLEASGIPKGSLKGLIAATGIELIPNGAELKKFTLDLECNEVSAFTFKVITNSDGKVESSKLLFKAKISQKGAGGRLEEYLNRVGQGEAQLKVGFAKQEDLDYKGEAKDDVPDEDGEGVVDEETNCVACNNAIPLVEGNDALHVSGQKCKKPREAAISSAREAEGGTPGRRPKKGLAVVQ